MELENDMASLDIADETTNKKKRRLSGLFKIPAHILEESSGSPDSDEVTESDQAPASEESTSSERPRRSGRKRIHPVESEKRRVITKPRKVSSGDTFNEIKNYYLDKRVRRLPPSLETIFEEPKQCQDQVTFMSSRKFRRIIDFNASVKNNPAKVKKRRLKAKGVSSTKRVRDKKFTIDFVMKHLAGLDDD